MVIGLIVYLALSLLAALVIFPALTVGSRADRWIDITVHQLSERQLSGTFTAGDERERDAIAR
ncbi:MAG TPA: hypothetical protein VN960_09390 [Gaiellaceae bacterium]|nr:hypothetical protein [Gaiellaceae bacterium]